MPADKWLFDNVFQKMLPDLTQHLTSIEFSKGFWLQKWISTLFLYSLPKGYCIRFWDFLFTKGVSQMFPLVVTILYFFKEKMMEMDFVGCYELITSLQEEENMPPVDEIIKEAGKLDIDWKSLNVLYKKYQEEIEREDFAIRKRNTDMKGKNEDNPQDTDRELRIEEIVDERQNMFPEIKRISKFINPPEVVSKSSDRIILPPINQEKKNKFVFESASLILSEEELSKRENKFGNSMGTVNLKNDYQQSIQIVEEEEEEEKKIEPLIDSSSKNKQIQISERIEGDDSVLFASAQNRTIRLGTSYGSIDFSAREIRAKVITKEFVI